MMRQLEKVSLEEPEPLDAVAMTKAAETEREAREAKDKAIAESMARKREQKEKQKAKDEAEAKEEMREHARETAKQSSGHWVSDQQIDWWNRELRTQSANLIKEKRYSGRLLYRIEELERYKARSELLIFGSNKSSMPSGYRHEFIVGEFISHLHHKGKTFRQFYDSKDWKAIRWVAVFGFQSKRPWVRLLSAYVMDRAMLDSVYIMDECVSPDDVLDIENVG